MEINLKTDFYPRVEAIRWLSRCGESGRPDFGIAVQWTDERTTALRSMFSTQWADAMTEAQGRLTGYLAKTDYDTYGGTWNKLAKESRAILENVVRLDIAKVIEEGNWIPSLAHTPLPEMTPAVQDSIGQRMVDLRTAEAWDQCLLVEILLNVNLAALELAYRQQFPKAPIFFERLLRIYEAGRLPCGWEGDLDKWPEGRLLVH